MYIWIYIYIYILNKEPVLVFLPTKYIFFPCSYESRFEAKREIVGTSQDYNTVEKWAMTAHLRVSVHANFKGICKVQETRK